MAHSVSDLDKIRQDYSLARLDEDSAGNDPVLFFIKWFSEAIDAEISEVNAMTLATVDATGKPHARIVLLKGLENGGFTFFTNYNSAKGNQVAENNHVALLFFWKELERQVRVEGIITKLSPEASDEYYHSRPEGSRIGAWASPQSTVIPSREVLEVNYAQLARQYQDGNIPRPEHWGGYQVIPHTIEFWQGRSSRLHDRIRFRQDEKGVWLRERLAP